MRRRTKMTIMLLAFLFGCSTALYAQKNVTGFWKTIDDETGLPKSVVAVYTVDNQLYGRVILIYEEDGRTVADDLYRKQKRSPYLEGRPALAGLDFIWGLEYDSRKDQWRGGSIMDPGDDKEKKPKIYGAEIWQEGRDLTVRGKIAFFGRNQTWKPFSRSDFPGGFRIPDYTSFRPAIPKIK